MAAHGRKSMGMLWGFVSKGGTANWKTKYQSIAI
jgi:hypothetical protein